ncbi:MAG: adenylate/guanylate cyclase domain-containing protein [Mycobacterium sp.]
MTPDDESTEPPRSSPTRLGIGYATGLTFAHLLTAAEVLAVVWALSGQTLGDSQVLQTRANLAIATVVVGLGTVAAAVGGYLNISPSLRWFVDGLDPDARQRRAAVNIVRHQSVLLLVIWAVGGAVMIVANVGAGVGPIALIVFAFAFGSTSTLSTSLLFTQGIFRQVVAAATGGEPVSRTTAPGIATRLVMMWLVNSALPSATIVGLIVCKANGWLMPKTASLDIPIVVLSVVAVALGLRALILVARSIADPVRDVVHAMAEVERGHLGRTVDVYEQSEIGRLQRGFNQMVAGLAERDRLRDLFGRHVGPDVVTHAIEGDDSMSGEVREVAILFIDLVGSTQLAADLTPSEIAEVLNDFFRIVVAAVDVHDGVINQFQGDAALAIFGAPVEADDAATAALAAARELSAALRRLRVVDFGIGVSAGPVFAGNIGAENRHGYTVIGDPVNEAARLADTAKATPGRVMASQPAISRAGNAETQRWISHGPVALRGRAETTQASVPRGSSDQNGHHDDR